MRLKDILAYTIPCAGTILLSFLLNIIFFQFNFKYFVMFGILSSLLTLIVVSIICKYKNITIDIMAKEFVDDTSLLFNQIFIGVLITIPLVIFLNSFL